MCPGPGESIYFWMYRQGLSQRPLEEVVIDCMLAGRNIRPKDLRNYWNGWYRHDLMFGDAFSMDAANIMLAEEHGPMRYPDYPEHPYIRQPEIEERWVPCSATNKPMIKWSQGCMSKADAEAWPGQVYLAENLKGTKTIVIDVDGDHGDMIDLDTIRFFDRYRNITSTLEKPDLVFDWFVDNSDEWAGDLHTAMLPVSYHLTFLVDRIIPTMHFRKAHVDIIGNKANSLRYIKNKKYNGVMPMWMTEEIWDEIMGYIEDKEKR